MKVAAYHKGSAIHKVSLVSGCSSARNWPARLASLDWLAAKGGILTIPKAQVAIAIE